MYAIFLSYQNPHFRSSRCP